jgi:glutamate formiminotransferase
MPEMPEMPETLECVVNISEGADVQVLADLGETCGRFLLDVHRDADHNRSVFTLAGPGSELQAIVRALARGAVGRLDLRAHHGAHPRFGVLDVVPWVALSGRPFSDGPIGPAIEARDSFVHWAAAELDLPCFTYGPHRSLPEIRRRAWSDLQPDAGPATPHPTAGASAVGARPCLVAYNLWLAEADLTRARQVAGQVRGQSIRTLGLGVGPEVQVSCNLIQPFSLGPAQAYDAVVALAPVARAELVGLLPAAVLAAVPAHRWAELDISPEDTIEARLEEAGLDGGRA